MSVSTATEYRAQAQASGRSVTESWERCDSDGFLSQWASQQMQGIYLSNAEVVEQGFANMFVIFDLDGKIIATDDDQKKGDYGYYYLVRDDSDAARLGRFLTDSNAKNEDRRIANNAKKGIRTGWVRTPEMHEDYRGVVVASSDAVRAGRYTIVEDLDNL
jgi:hypothetical protein